MSNRLKTDISLQVDRAYAPLEDSEHDVAEQPAGDTALEESDNVSTRASPTGGESVGTVSSNAVERKVDAEGTHETNSRATPMDIESQPGSEQGREVEGFQYEASTEGRLVSPVLETKASSVDRHAPSDP